MFHQSMCMSVCLCVHPIATCLYTHRKRIPESRPPLLVLNLCLARVAGWPCLDCVTARPDDFVLLLHSHLSFT